MVKQGQNFLDKVLEQTGSLENAFEMALINDLSITDVLVIGDVLKPAGKIKNTIVSLFSENNEPATGLTVSFLAENGNFGIGKMAIGSTFIIR
jgi:hypothetical protein